MPMDLRRSTGYHRLSIGIDDYWFATDDTKVRLAGVEGVLSELGSLGKGWTGQIAFTDGQGLRVPHVVFGWLDLQTDRILTAAASIIRNPYSEQVSTQVLSRRGAGLGCPQPQPLPAM